MEKINFFPPPTTVLPKLICTTGDKYSKSVFEMTKYVTIAITDEMNDYYRSRFLKLGAFVRAKLEELMDEDVNYKNSKG